MFFLFAFSPSLLLSFSPLLPSFFLQKMTWKSRQADVDTCRMKGKHKVEKTHTHTQTPQLLCLHPDFIYGTIVTLFVTKHFFSKSHIIQCRQAVTDVISHRLSVFLSLTLTHTLTDTGNPEGAITHTCSSYNLLLSQFIEHISDNLHIK